MPLRHRITFSSAEIIRLLSAEIIFRTTQAGPSVHIFPHFVWPVVAPWLEDLSSKKTFVLRKTSNHVKVRTSLKQNIEKENVHVFKSFPNLQKSNQDSQDISTLEEMRQDWSCVWLRLDLLPNLQRKWTILAFKGDLKIKLSFCSIKVLIILNFNFYFPLKSVWIICTIPAL